jgi:methylglyoxal synthase
MAAAPDDNQVRRTIVVIARDNKKGDLEPHPHDPDVRALLRLADAWNIAVACNRASADVVICSPLFVRRYDRLQPDFAASGGSATLAASATQSA